MIPPNIRFFGDKDVARTLWHQGIQRLTLLQQSMEFMKLTHAFSRLIDETTGHEILCVTQRTPWSDENFMSDVLIYFPERYEASYRKTRGQIITKPYILLAAGRYEKSRKPYEHIVGYEDKLFSPSHYIVWDVTAAKVIFGPGTRAELEEFGIITGKQYIYYPATHYLDYTFFAVVNSLRPNNAPLNWPQRTNDATSTMFKLSSSHLFGDFDSRYVTFKGDYNVPIYYRAGVMLTKYQIISGTAHTEIYEHFANPGHCMPNENNVSGEEIHPSPNFDISIPEYDESGAFIGYTRTGKIDKYRYNANYQREPLLDNVVPYGLVSEDLHQ